MIRIFGNVVEADGVKKRLITIDNGVIVSTGSDDMGLMEDALMIHGAENFGPECLIFPGFVDIHTHCREDVSGKDTHKETYQTVSRAALSGGVVCVADMPNNPVVPYNAINYNQKRIIADQNAIVDVLLYAAINQDSRPFSVDFTPDQGEIIPKGFSPRSRQTDTPYKAFVGPSTNHSGDLNFDSESKLSLALSRYKGKSVSFHCEDPTILKAFADRATHEERRPPGAEATSIDAICNLIAEHGLRGKICHVSTDRGLDIILRAKEKGVEVQCEVTPHHLYFDTDMLTDENRRWLQMNPPIRPRSQRLNLLEAVRCGSIDYLATDHAPHTKDEKLKGTSGVPLLDTYGPFVAWLIKEQKVDPVTIFKMACKNPGEWVGQFWPDRKLGRILPGYEANITVLDLSKTAADGRHLFTKCGWSPFDLRTLPGMVRTVWKAGQKMVDGEYMI